MTEAGEDEVFVVVEKGDGDGENRDENSKLKLGANFFFTSRLSKRKSEIKSKSETKSSPDSKSKSISEKSRSLPRRSVTDSPLPSIKTSPLLAVKSSPLFSFKMTSPLSISSGKGGKDSAGKGPKIPAEKPPKSGGKRKRLFSSFRKRRSNDDGINNNNNNEDDHTVAPKVADDEADKRDTEADDKADASPKMADVDSPTPSLPAQDKPAIIDASPPLVDPSDSAAPVVSSPDDAGLPPKGAASKSASPSFSSRLLRRKKRTKAPKILTTMEPTTSLPGASVSFSCRFLAGANAVVTWIHGGVEVGAASGRRVVVSTPVDAAAVETTMRIDGVEFEDEGDVVVVVKNEAGWVSAKARLCVGGPPVLTSPLHDIAIPAGTSFSLSVSFDARIRSTEDPNVTWFYGQTKIFDDGDRDYKACSMRDRGLIVASIIWVLFFRSKVD